MCAVSSLSGVIRCGAHVTRVPALPSKGGDKSVDSEAKVVTRVWIQKARGTLGRAPLWPERTRVYSIGMLVLSASTRACV